MSNQQDKSPKIINQRGNFTVGYQENGVVLSSEAKNTYYENYGNADAVEDLREIIEYLSNEFPTATDAEKEVHFKGKLQSQVRNNPDFGTRLRGAIVGGGTELAKVLAENTFLSVSIETVRGWLQPQ